MLTWDEEVKPSLPVLNSVPVAGREVDYSPLSQAPSQSNPTAQPALRTLDDGAVVPVAQPLKPVAVAAAATATGIGYSNVNFQIVKDSLDTVAETFIVTLNGVGVGGTATGYKLIDSTITLTTIAAQF